MKSRPTRSDWPRVPMGELCSINAPIIDPKLPEYRDLPHVNGENIESATGRLLMVQSAAEDGMTSGKYLFEPGAVLYSKLRPYLCKVAVADFRGLCSADMYPLVFDSDRVSLDFAKFVLLSEEFTGFAVAASNRARMPKINREQLLAFPFPVPTLAEQKRIADRLTAALTTADAARQAARDRLAAAEALPAAYLREAFESPAVSEWEWARFGDVSAVSGGIQKTPERAPVQHHRPYLTVRNVQRGSLDLSQVERFEVTPDELKRLRLIPGDILIVEGNGSPDQIGRNALFTIDGEEWIHQNHVICCRPGPRVVPQFASYYLNSPSGREQMIDRARSTSGLYTLSVQKVSSLTVPLPDPAIQHRIAVDLSVKLAAADRLIAQCRDELAAVDALPAALLREAFGDNGSPSAES